jgi:hypothetical protein
MAALTGPWRNTMTGAVGVVEGREHQVKGCSGLFPLWRRPPRLLRD